MKQLRAIMRTSLDLSQIRNAIRTRFLPFAATPVASAH